MAVHNRGSHGIGRMLMNCIPLSGYSQGQQQENPVQGETNSTISVIRLQLGVDEIKCCRKITLKKVYGPPTPIILFIAQFRKKLTDQTNSLPGNLNSDFLDESKLLK